MSDLIGIAFTDEHRAAEVLTTLRQWQREYLVDMEDAVVVVKDKAGKIKLNQTVNLVPVGAMRGSLWGLLIGLLFGLPLVGVLGGAASGALFGKLADYGIDDQLIRNCSATLAPGTSAIFILVRKITLDKVLPELQKFDGTVIKTSLPTEAEELLRAPTQTVEKAIENPGDTPTA